MVWVLRDLGSRNMEEHGGNILAKILRPVHVVSVPNVVMSVQQFAMDFALQHVPFGLIKGGI